MLLLLPSGDVNEYPHAGLQVAEHFIVRSSFSVMLMCDVLGAHVMLSPGPSVVNI